MPIPGLSRNDMVAIQRREMRTEKRLENALAEITRLKAIIKALSTQNQDLTGTGRQSRRE